MATGTKRVLVVTGEASGDLLGANMLKAAAQVAPELEFYGIGGPRMKAAGCRILRPASDLAVMGLFEVVKHLPRIYRLFRMLKRTLYAAPEPDVVVLIDSPDFNLRIAKQARKAGIPVLYYVSPQVWAWRRRRVYSIARDVDKLAAILPFEPEYYQGLNIDVRYVGHPLLDEAVVSHDPTVLKKQHGLDNARPVIGLLPGSRGNEIHYSLPTILAAAEKLRKRYADIGFLLPLAPGLERALVQNQIDKSGLDINLADESIYDIVAACDAVIAVSGTVTLQTALVKTPMVIIYKGSPLTYAIGRLIVSIKHFGLPNIVAGKTVVKELLQGEAEPEAIAGEIFRIIDDHSYRAAMVHELEQVRARMGEPGCAERVAGMVLELCMKGDS